MSRAIHLVRDGDVQLAAIAENGTLTDLMAERADEAVRPGDIYLGKVDRWMKDTGAAYVDLGLGRPAFLQDAGFDAQTAILVQVARVARDDKSIEVTRDIALAGVRLVYRPFGAGIAVSRKLDSDTARHWRPDPPGGWIIRSAAVHASAEEMAEEVSRLAGKWRTIAEMPKSGATPQRLSRGPDVAARLVLDTPDVDEIRVDDADWRRSVSAWLGDAAPKLLDAVRDSPIDLMEEVPALLADEVPLPQGGSIAIEGTRALTVIDVNAGRRMGEIDQVNREAARAIARQLRLRNIGGIVVVDFISMKRRESRNAVVDLFRILLDGDSAHIRLSRGMSGLGLVELARERRGTALADVMADR